MNQLPDAFRAYLESKRERLTKRLHDLETGKITTAEQIFGSTKFEPTTEREKQEARAEIASIDGMLRQ